MEIKQCSKCEIEYPATTEYFRKAKVNKDGFHPWCKPCVKEYNKSYKPKKNYYKGYQYQKEWIKQQRYRWGAGVYGIFSNGKCLYVGESTTLHRRLYQHSGGIKNPHTAIKSWRKFYNEITSKHNNLVVGILEQTENHKEREKHYINKLKPLYND